ncbi:MAG: hypothetical protein QOK35_1725 [Pseudonocardiales bacterium]|jgi:hypothetical protein|nr:hypothetical protein [Pseudonocardiales bacterium]
MVQFGRSAEGRDDSATDRDDVADGRDVDAAGRDTAATGRDVDAGDRDALAGSGAEDLHDRLARVRRQLLDRLAGPEGTDLDRDAVRSLCDDLRTEIEDSRAARRAAAHDRQAAARDRHAADRDRRLAEQDRTDAARDRNQAAIERQQDTPVHPVHAPRPEGHGEDGSLIDRTARAVAGSRQRITDGRAYLSGDPDGTRAQSPDPPVG